MPYLSTFDHQIFLFSFSVFKRNGEEKKEVGGHTRKRERNSELNQARSAYFDTVALCAEKPKVHLGSCVLLFPVKCFSHIHPPPTPFPYYCEAINKSAPALHAFNLPHFRRNKSNFRSIFPAFGRNVAYKGDGWTWKLAI